MRTLRFPHGRLIQVVQIDSPNDYYAAGPHCARCLLACPQLLPDRRILGDPIGERSLAWLAPLSIRARAVSLHSMRGA